MDLMVPNAEKDEAEALGALWDASRRRWYVPPGLDPQPFRRWIPPRDTGTPGLNLRAEEAYVVTAPWRCGRCGQATIVAGFLMAPGFEDFSVWEDEAGTTSCTPSTCVGVTVSSVGMNYKWISPGAGLSGIAPFAMPTFKTSLSREILRQAPISAAICP